MIEHIFIFPAEEDLPIPFITWARGSQQDVSIKLQFLATHTNVIVKGDIITAFNTCIFDLGQWHHEILQLSPSANVNIPQTLKKSEEQIESEKRSDQRIKVILNGGEIFNPGHKHKLSPAEALGPAMRITDIEEAERYLIDYITFLIKGGAGGWIKGELAAKKNLLAYSRQHDDETSQRVQRLFHCSEDEILKLQA